MIGIALHDGPERCECAEADREWIPFFCPAHIFTADEHSVEWRCDTCEAWWDDEPAWAACEAMRLREERSFIRRNLRRVRQWLGARYPCWGPF